MPSTDKFLAMRFMSSPCSLEICAKDFRRFSTILDCCLLTGTEVIWNHSCCRASSADTRFSGCLSSSLPKTHNLQNKDYWQTIEVRRNAGSTSRCMIIWYVLDVVFEAKKTFAQVRCCTRQPCELVSVRDNCGNFLWHIKPL